MPKSKTNNVFLSPEDMFRYGDNGDADFNADRNKSIIARTIKKTNANYKRRKKMANEGIQERSHLIASYIRHMEERNKDMTIEDYAGWFNLKKLWGETRAEEMQQLARLQGKIIN